MFQQKLKAALYSSIVASLFTGIVFLYTSSSFFGSMIVTFFIVSLYVFPIIFLFALPVSISYDYLFGSAQQIWTSLFWHIAFAMLPNLFQFLHRFEDGLLSLNMLMLSVPVALIFVFFDAWTKKKGSRIDFQLNRAQKGALVLLPTVLALGFYFLFLHTDYRTPNQYVIPDGYVGWIYINYNVTDAEPLPEKEGKLLLEIGEDGILSTSNSIEYGAARDEYYYRTENGDLKRLLISEHIFASSVSSSEDAYGREMVQERFFVGTEEQFEQAEKSYD